MSELRVDKISPQSGTEINLGDSGDILKVPSGGSLKINNVDVVAVAPSTSGKVLTSDGTNWTSTTPAGGGYTSEALVSLTSGTEKDITIASGVTSIVIHFNLISSNGGSSVMCMQLGDAGGIETSDYISVGMNILNAADPSSQSTTGCFYIGPRMAGADALVGAITLTRGDTSTHYWSVVSVLTEMGAEDMKLHSGNKTLSAELTTIRLIAAGSYDGAGSYSLSYM